MRGDPGRPCGTRAEIPPSAFFRKQPDSDARRGPQMLIEDIVPYGRNARHSEGAIPAVADSIREFGLRGTIGLESRERPVIVFGHTRVAACKSLGWAEIPDEKIEYCDDLTEDQIKAFRIADNKTGDIATYNKAMLREEVRGIKGIDMARFGCDFKPKLLPYGAERLKTDRAHNLDIVSRGDCGPSGFPELDPVDALPSELQGFNYAKSTPDEGKSGKGWHFFADDYQFERVWTSPGKHLASLRGYDCVPTPDFSPYMDMPAPMQAWNRYRSQALGRYWQDAGLLVVPTLSWAQPDSYAFCFDGVQRHATVATSIVGAARDEDAQKVWHGGMRGRCEGSSRPACCCTAATSDSTSEMPRSCITRRVVSLGGRGVYSYSGNSSGSIDDTPLGTYAVASLNRGIADGTTTEAAIARFREQLMDKKSRILGIY